MFKELKEHISARFPELKNKHILVACSGGVDSVTLAHLCKDLHLNFAMAHCNFKLRGADSEADEVFVAELAQKLEVPFFCKHFDTYMLQKEAKGSVQMVARTLRYEWFQHLATEEIEKLLTAERILHLMLWHLQSHMLIQYLR